jgi:type III pantothenate kinase
LDCGTATTLSVLHPARGFLGGAIAPGIELMRDSLARGAAQLFEVPLEAPSSSIGTHTLAALQSGIVFGYAALVDGLIERMKAELEPTGSAPYRLVTTGGNARHLLGVSRYVREWDPDLTLRGIASLA